MKLLCALGAAWVLLDASAGMTFASTIEANATVNLVQSDSESNSHSTQQLVSAQETAEGITAYSSASLLPSLSVFASSVGQHIGEADGNSSLQATFHVSPGMNLGGAPLVLSFNFELTGNLSVTPGNPSQGFSMAASEVYFTASALSGAAFASVSGALGSIAGITNGGGTYVDTLTSTGLFSGDTEGSVSHSFSLPITLTPLHNDGTLSLFLNCTAFSSSTSAASCDFSHALSLSSITIEQGGLGTNDLFVAFDGGPLISVSSSNPSPTPAPEPQTWISVIFGYALVAVVRRGRTQKITPYQHRSLFPATSSLTISPVRTSSINITSVRSLCKTSMRRL